jgi:hypothetical protein
VTDCTAFSVCRAGRPSRRTDDTWLIDGMMLNLSIYQSQVKTCNYKDRVIVTPGLRDGHRLIRRNSRCSPQHQRKRQNCCQPGHQPAIGSSIPCLPVFSDQRQDQTSASFHTGIHLDNPALYARFECPGAFSPPRIAQKFSRRPLCAEEKNMRNATSCLTAPNPSQTAQESQAMAYRKMMRILGGCSRARTYDPLIKSQLLYRLS